LGFGSARSTVPKAVSVFECIFDQMSNKVAVYDCAVANGQNVRQQCLTNRINFAAEILEGQCLAKGAPVRTQTQTLAPRPWSDAEEEEEIPISVAKYTSHDGVPVVNKQNARRVLFVKDSAPLGFFPGGDAYAWKAPTLNGSVAVLTCRMGECLAVSTRGNCLMKKVGKLVHTSDVEHMGTYVCELVAVGCTDRLWRAVRLAKSSERLFTVEECSGTEFPLTQITRDGMIKLLGSVLNKTVASETHLPLFASAVVLPRARVCPPKPDKGWVPVSASKSVRKPPTATSTKKPVTISPPEEQNTYWVLEDEGADAWHVVGKKK
jgi:hypothetical protein